MSRIILSVKEIHSFAGKGMSVNDLENRLSEDNEYRHRLAKKYAMKYKLHNGATLEFPAHGYRNHNLLFWDAQNEEIVEPFSEIDDYGSVPPRFVVGDGYFNPGDWLEEVDHNSYLFPSQSLIDEMKEFVAEYPSERKMIVNINGSEYTVHYNTVQMKDHWDGAYLEVFDNAFNVFPGDPNWRETIVTLPKEALPEKTLPEKTLLEKDQIIKMIEQINAKLRDLTSSVEQLNVLIA